VRAIAVDEQRPERDETGTERLDRQLNELIQEVRLALPGAQVLFAFLLTVPFTTRFETTTAFQRDVFFATLVGAALTTALLLTPTALHRLRFGLGDKRRIVKTANRVTLAALAVLAVTMSGVVLLVTSLIFTIWVAWIVAAATLTVTAGLWFALPLATRFRKDG
jgi:Family of unknown function (DUF6328)